MKKLVLHTLFLGFFLALLLFACHKDTVIPTSKNNLLENGEGITNREESVEVTVLGERLNIPYTPEVVTQAYNALHNA